MRNTVWLLAACALVTDGIGAAADFEGTGRIDFHGYTQCVKLENDQCRVVLGHHCGGRVLEYALKGANVVALHPDGAGKVYDPATKKGGAADGGRCDIGPEKVIPPHPDLWVGPWQAEITGPRAARLTSVEDKATGVQLIRDFVLDKASTHLRFTQSIKNVSDEAKHWCHWSRTFAPGGGIVVIPLSPTSRFPKHWVMYGGGDSILYNPHDDQIVTRDGFLLVTGTPANPKLGMDSAVGWLAYLMKNDLLFVKRYPVYPERAYGEIAGLTISIWYFKDELCELEPIGPRNHIAPGQSASFTEDWWILPHKYPPSAAVLDLAGLKAQVERDAR
ncbi:MAG TPA: hypothetical protein VNE39_12180 [Planctomycetota bacterium]|nr:hypothetical protein [Planctomycetota bacterium]